jgi:SnoaL-like domain
LIFENRHSLSLRSFHISEPDIDGACDDSFQTDGALRRSLDVDTYLQDRLAIADLMTGWMHRDLAEWDQLRALFHADGVIEITWFEGKFSDFVDGSMRMNASDIRTKHLIAAPVVIFHNDKAVAETNAMIIAENTKLRVGCSMHCRFYDEIERRAGAWKIVKRQVVYDMGSFTFPFGIVDLDAETIQKYPSEYAALAYLLDKSGFPVHRVFATKGSALEETMKDAGQAWLRS